jgi:hypothetical protein
MNVSEVALTLILMDTYITLMTRDDIDRSLNETDTVTTLENIVLTIITIPLTLSPLCLLLLVRLRGCIVNLCTFYFYKLIGKLTAFLQLQEFSLRNPTVSSNSSSTTAARRSPHNSNLRLAIFSPRLQHYGLSSISTVMILTRLIDERFASVMGECVILTTQVHHCLFIMNR